MKVDNVITFAPEVGKVLHLTNDYAVQICIITDAETKQDLTVYGIINTGTGVREAELRGFHHAIQWANKMQSETNKLTEEALQTDLLLESMPDVYNDSPEAADVEDTASDLSAKEAGDILSGVVDQGTDTTTE